MEHILESIMAYTWEGSIKLDEKLVAEVIFTEIIAVVITGVIFVELIVV